MIQETLTQTHSQKKTMTESSMVIQQPTDSSVTSQEPVLPQVDQNVKDSIGKWVTPDKRRKVDSEPYPQTSYLRKYYSGKDKNLPKELKDLFTPLKCNLCHCSMGSTVTAKDHYEGKKHISNIKKWIGEHPEYNNLYQTDTNQQKMAECDGLYCKYCDVMLSSEQQAQSHYIGKKHQCAVNGGVVKSACLNAQTVWERSSAIDVDNMFGIGYWKKEATANQRFFCETCQVACPSLITFNDHLSGAKHKKKVTLLLDSEPSHGKVQPLTSTSVIPVGVGGASSAVEHTAVTPTSNPAKAYRSNFSATKDNILEDVIKNDKKPTSPADLSIYRTPSGKYYCHSCNVTVNSPIQFLQHSDSRKHKLKSSNKMFK